MPELMGYLRLKETLFNLQSCHCYPRVKRRCLSSSVTALSPGPSEVRTDGNSFNGNDFHGPLGHRAREKLADKVSDSNFFCGDDGIRANRHAV